VSEIPSRENSLSAVEDPKRGKSIAERAGETGLLGLGYGFAPQPGTLLDLSSFPFRLVFHDGSTLLVERVALIFCDGPLSDAVN
jgi:hypothetical protein